MNAASDNDWFRFRPTFGWLEHVWKCVVVADHQDMIPLLRPLLPADGVAIDIGAHGGQVSRVLADLAPRGLVVAVEPSSYSRSVMRTALLIRPRRNVRMVATALGPAPGVGVLATPIKRRGAMGYGAASLAPEAERRAVSEVVPVITLDALVEAMALPRVDVLKIDVEGYEHGVLRGARGTLERFHPAIIAELDASRILRTGSTIEALWEEMMALGYEARALPDPRPPATTGDWLFTWRG